MNEDKWRLVKASVIGLSHLNSKTICQDRLTCQTLKTNEGEILIAVIGDGAGSTSEGQTGAEIACQSFVAQIASYLTSTTATVRSLNEDFAKHWISHFQKKVTEKAKEKNKDLREFATTLVGAVIGKTSGVFFQVSDDGAVFSTTGEPTSYRFAVEPEDSEYVNMTDFLTDETAFGCLKFNLIEEPIEDLILFSDGIYSVAVDYRSNQPHEPFLRPMIAPLRNKAEVNGLNEKLESFLASPKLNEKTDDDKTIILASRAVTEGSE
jgi:serine/threonine protein phosphatase PrpC